jgi:hypothetical protein
MESARPRPALNVRIPPCESVIVHFACACVRQPNAVCYWFSDRLTDAMYHIVPASDTRKVTPQQQPDTTLDKDKEYERVEDADAAFLLGKWS